MADFYTGISKTVTKLVGKFGKSITIYKTSGGTFDPVLGVESAGRTKSQKVSAVVLPASGGKIQALDLRYGLTGMQYQRLSFCTLSGAELSWLPDPGDAVKVGADTWTVLGTTPLNPNAGKPIVYEMALRI